MKSYTETPELPENTFILLRDLIQERLGLYFEDEKRNFLAGKLSPLVIQRGLSTFLDYFYLLKYNADAATEWLSVINHLAVQETYFWRDFEQIRVVAEILPPQYFSSRLQPPLRIWSAACSSGEEPLTVAMALEEMGSFQQGPIEICASDVSPTVIERARQGLFRERSLRHLPLELRTRYFTAEGEL
jgi:chemotaxis protein methyltransferase CheR